MKKSFFLIFATIMLLGCSNFSKQEAVTEMSMIAMSDMDISPEDSYYEEKSFSDEVMSSNRNVKSVENKNSPVNNQPIINKKIIKTGSVEIQSDNVQKSRDELEKLLNNTKSYVQKEYFDNDYYRETFRVTARVPNQYFDTLINALSNNKGIGIVRNKQISTKDVTEEYYDTEIRLKNKELYLAKYRDFLSQAKKISDMLEIQEKIRNMEEEIESAKGKLRFIDDRVNFSTLDISIYREKPNITNTSELGFFGRLWESIVTGWNVLAEIFFGILSSWSVILIISVIIWGIVKMVKARKNRKAKQ